MVLNERMSRPECLDRESYTAGQNFVHTDFVSWRPVGSSGLGCMKETIWSISAFV